MAPEPFDRIVCGVDESPEALEAVRQAEMLRAREGTLALVAAAEVALAVHGGWDAPRIEPSNRVRTQFPKPARGRACRHHADLLVVGSRGLHGVRSLGSVSERAAHRAACSVLVVRS